MEVVASLSQGRTAAAQCGLFTYKSVPVIFEPPYTLGASMHAAMKTSFKHMGLCKVSSGRGMRNVKQKKPHKYAGGHDCLKGSLQHCGQAMTSRYLPVNWGLLACWYSFHMARRIKST